MQYCFLLSVWAYIFFLTVLYNLHNTDECIFVHRNYIDEQPAADETCICNSNGINTDTAGNDEHIRRNHVVRYIALSSCIIIHQCQRTVHITKQIELFLGRSKIGATKVQQPRKGSEVLHTASPVLW